MRTKGAHRHLVPDMPRAAFRHSSGPDSVPRPLRRARADDVALTPVVVPARSERLLTITGADAALTIRGDLAEIPTAQDAADRGDRPPPR
ncbi:hypothetical protein NX801_07595 [Streptomyces sp. LP05-1]|uniref:Uncharacterized protein n=1 Tax=Streptomyces pyxinae TaxID=2970734 RepID=A0ABT2CDN4_9ACTN|nr:hypothetical protein [Streptomyces sp. LP05-1]MCS0635523.1 hypothetical protein [Streptomyces sp. LP05-1]